jgi:hypothetical protein
MGGAGRLRAVFLTLFALARLIALAIVGRKRLSGSVPSLTIGLSLSAYRHQRRRQS